MTLSHCLQCRGSVSFAAALPAVGCLTKSFSLTVSKCNNNLLYIQDESIMGSVVKNSNTENTKIEYEGEYIVKYAMRITRDR